MLIAIVIGFAFGFIGSMPVAGPIAVLIFARSLEARYRSAFQIGLGGALAEMVYAFLAFWGFSTLLTSHAWVVPVSRGVAAAILLGLGISFMLKKTDSEAEAAPQRRGKSFALGFTICALNPTFIATWTGAATTLFSTGLVEFEPAMAYPFGLAAGAGILSWYIVLISLIRRFKDRFSQKLLNRVIQGFGVFLVGVGLWFAWRLVAYLIES